MLAPSNNKKQTKVGNIYKNREISTDNIDLINPQSVYGSEMSSMQRISFPPPPINEDDIVVGDDAPLKDDFTILLIIAFCFVYIKHLSRKIINKKT